MEKDFKLYVIPKVSLEDKEKIKITRSEIDASMAFKSSLSNIGYEVKKNNQRKRNPSGYKTYNNITSFYNELKKITDNFDNELVESDLERQFKKKGFSVDRLVVR